MSEKIKVGDLVMIVRAANCGCDIGISKIFTVKAIEVNTGDDFYCEECGCDTPENIRHAMIDKESNEWAELSQLKKIKPLSELEQTKITEEVPV